MANVAFVQLDLDEARLLADLNGVAFDLESTYAFSQLLKAQLESQHPNFGMIDALTTAVLVRYARSFVSGVRGKLDKSHLSRLTAEQRELHDRFIEWRSKHVAHSVNPFEQNQAVAHFASDRVREEGIRSVSVQQNRLVSFSDHELASLQDLVRSLQGIVSEQITSEQARLLMVVRSLPVEQVLAGPQMTVWRVGVEAVSQRRHRSVRRPTKQ